MTKVKDDPQPFDDNKAETYTYIPRGAPPSPQPPQKMDPNYPPYYYGNPGYYRDYGPNHYRFPPYPALSPYPSYPPNYAPPYYQSPAKAVSPPPQQGYSAYTGWQQGPPPAIAPAPAPRPVYYQEPYPPPQSGYYGEPRQQPYPTQPVEPVGPYHYHYPGYGLAPICIPVRDIDKQTERNTIENHAPGYGHDKERLMDGTRPYYGRTEAEMREDDAKAWAKARSKEIEPKGKPTDQYWVCHKDGGMKAYPLGTIKNNFGGEWKTDVRGYPYLVEK